MSLFRRRPEGDFNFEHPSGGKRFVKTYSQGVVDGIEIWVDRETGVNYLYRKVGYGGGLTVLVNREGQPLISTLPI